MRGEEVLKLLLLLVKIGLPGLGLAHVRTHQRGELRLRTLNGARREARRLGGEDASSAGRRCAGSDWQATKANHWLGCKTGQNLRRNRRAAHHGAGGADVVGGRADVAAASLVLAHGVVRRVAVVDRQVAVLLADGLRVILRDFLRDEADLRAGVALVVVAVDILAVVGLADLLDVFLEALVREEAAAPLRVGRRGVAGQRARAGRDVREELSNLEGIRLLLLELVVEGLKASLRRLLLGLTGSELRLSTSEASRLSAGPELAKLRTSLTEALEVRLLRREADALLLASRGQRLIVGLLVDRVHGLSRAQSLLPREVCRNNARAVAAEGARRLGVHQVGTLRGLLLLQGLQRRGGHGLRVGVVVLPHVQGAGVRTARARSRQARRRAVIGLRGTGHCVRVLDARLLRLRQGRNEGIGIATVLLIRRLGNGIGARVDGIVSLQNLRRDLHRLRCGSAAFSAAAHSLTSIIRLPEQRQCGFRKGSMPQPGLRKCVRTCGFCPTSSDWTGRQS